MNPSKIQISTIVIPKENTLPYSEWETVHTVTPRSFISDNLGPMRNNNLLSTSSRAIAKNKSFQNFITSVIGGPTCVSLPFAA